MAKLDAFFKVMRDHHASDLHLAVGQQPILRIHGTLRRVEYPKLTDEVLRPMLYEILAEKQIERIEKPRDLDFSHAAPGLARFRVNVFVKNTGLAAAFRMIPFQVSTLDELGAPTAFQHVCHGHSGLVLVTGPTGSGKSTTLAAMIDHVNRTTNAHVVTLEDPIEFVHTPRRCMFSQREVGSHCENFVDGLRSALREDPDVILVGELRDLETIQLAITAAETGHLVFGTLHTTSASRTVDRIIDVFPTDRQSQIRTMLSESLRAVISQKLLPRADGNGRVAAYEVLVATSAIRSMIREGKTFQIPSAIETVRKEGMQTLELALRDLVHNGLVSLEEAGKYADLSDAGEPRPVVNRLQLVTA